MSGPVKVGTSPNRGALTKRVKVRKDKTNPRRIAYVILFLFAAPPPWPLFVFGTVLIIAAVLFHGWAAGYLARAGYQERSKILTVRGPYRHNRNPYYVAHMTMDFGFFCVAGLPWLYLFYFPVIYSVYRRWVMNEEPFLEKEFGDDYRRFTQAVPRWRVRLTPGPAQGREQRFEWRIFRLNKEMGRALAHMIVLGVFVFYFLAGNPVATVDPFARATGGAAIAIWFLLHDIIPLDVSRVHAGWLLPFTLTALSGPIALTFAPVWKPWSGAAGWCGAIAGALLALILALAALPAVARRTGKTLNDLFAQPLCQWYVLGFACGLLSLTLGGVWIGILVPFAWWGLGLAGVVPIRPVPQSTLMSVGLLALFCLYAAHSIARLLG